MHQRVMSCALVALCALFLHACGGSGNGASNGDADLPSSIEQVFTGLTFPQMTDIVARSDGQGGQRVYVVRKNGVVESFDPGAATPRAETYLDVSGTADFDTSGEQGLLSLAFDPDFADNGHVYIKLVRDDPRRVVVLRLRDEGHRPLDLSTATEVLIADDYDAQPNRTNHVAGDIAFGPVDGYLYITLGDGGGSFDPDGAAQDRADLRGSILRIDVDGTTAAGGAENYAVPGDNPFSPNASGFREEIYAYGLRNPFKLTIERVDATTQRVWVGDVGQNAREEVDLIEAGGNYGWDCREGTRVVDETKASGACDGLSPAAFIAPVLEYDHSLGTSITGGLVYRGSRLAGALSGRYVYGDFTSGRIWALDPATSDNDLLVNTDVSIVTFGEGVDGALYFGGFSDGRLYRLAP